MEAYLKPMMRALVEDVGSCGCNFRANETPKDTSCSIANLPPTVGGGPCVTVDIGRIDTTGEINTQPILTNTIVGVSDGSIRVTPLDGTGIPGTQPITFGIPVGTRGIYVDVTLQGQNVAVAPSGAGVVVAGTPILLP